MQGVKYHKQERRKKVKKRILLYDFFKEKQIYKFSKFYNNYIYKIKNIFFPEKKHSYKERTPSENKIYLTYDLDKKITSRYSDSNKNLEKILKRNIYI